jgi:hypothetical protein
MNLNILTFEFLLKLILRGSQVCPGVPHINRKALSPQPDGGETLSGSTLLCTPTLTLVKLSAPGVHLQILRGIVAHTTIEQANQSSH